MPSLEVAAWRREPRAFGRVRWTPPEGDTVAEILIEERARPLMSLRALVAQRAPQPGTISEVKRITTQEGELGALVTFDAADGHHLLAVIVGDDFQTIVEARATDPAQRARVRTALEEIVVHLPLALGASRPRRYWYRPPAGWSGIARGMTTIWIPPDHPNNPTILTVLPARPMGEAFALDSFFRDDSFADVSAQDITRSEFKIGAFMAMRAHAHGKSGVFVTIALEDQRFMYVLRMATTSARLATSERLLLEVAESCVSLPMPRPRRDEASTHMFNYLVM
jgi:hypothetical protein